MSADGVVALEVDGREEREIAVGRTGDKSSRTGPESGSMGSGSMGSASIGSSGSMGSASCNSSRIS